MSNPPHRFFFCLTASRSAGLPNRPSPSRGITASRPRAAVSPVMSEVILISVVIALGVFLLLLGYAWSSAEFHRSTEQTNREVIRQWSLLTVEHAHLSGDGTAVVWLSNPGRYQLVVLRCVVYQAGSNPPSTPYRELTRVPPEMREAKRIDCEVKGNGPNYVVEVFAMPEPLYDPHNPTANAQYGLLIRYPLGGEVP